MIRKYDIPITDRRNDFGDGEVKRLFKVGGNNGILNINFGSVSWVFGFIAIVSMNILKLVRDQIIKYNKTSFTSHYHQSIIRTRRYFEQQEYSSPVSPIYCYYYHRRWIFFSPLNHLHSHSHSDHSKDRTHISNVQMFLQSKPEANRILILDFHNVQYS